VLLARADGAGDVYLPGYTHLQRAQPVLLAHHLLAHFWALAATSTAGATRCARRRVAARRRRARGLEPAARSRRHRRRARLRRRFDNSLDAVSDRDFVAEALFVARSAGAPLALGEEIVLWSTEEFGFLPLADAYAPVVDAAAEEEPRHRRARRGARPVG
jgi:argininosuccinate lyase